MFSSNKHTFQEKNIKYYDEINITEYSGKNEMQYIPA